MSVENRPGLTEIGYRCGTHGDFVATMVGELSSSLHPALSALRTRDPDDLTIALVDAWAVACDVLSFYSERLAHESYLRTSTERTSLQELGKLVAYRLSPGVAAETWLAFALERPLVTAPVADPDPGQLPPAVPTVVTVPAGLRAQSVPGPGELPQTFETVEEVEARPEWNALPVVRTKEHAPVRNRVDAWLAGVGLGLAKGDAILFASSDLVNDRWDLRLLTEVDVDASAGRTHVRWEYGLGSHEPSNDPADEPAVFALRKRIPVFGHNAPVWAAMHTDFREGYLDAYPLPEGGDIYEWPSFEAVRTVDGLVQIDLEGAHPDVVRGSWVVVSQDTDGFYRELYEVVERAELSRAEFAVSGKVTRLRLQGEPHTFGSPRQVTVMAVAEPLSLAEAPDGTAVTGTTFVVEGDATGMAKGRVLVLAGTSPGGAARAETLTLESAVGLADGRTRLTFASPSKSSFDRSTAVVYGNVAHATHGETVTQILGSGDAREAFQTFGLRQGPLTFVPADNPRGASSTLEVEVDGVRWAERTSTYGAAAADRVFVTRDEPDGTVSVVLGDGKRGARPSSGSNNVRATYRKGIGGGGNLRPNQVGQLLDRPLGLKGVTNPLPATGGADPEHPDHARAAIPVPVRTLGRAVSLLDFADFALAFTGIGKASATVLSLRPGRTVVVTVADEAGQPPAASTVERLAAAITAQADPTVRVRVLPCRSATFRIALKVKVDPARDSETVRAAVADALRSTYAPAARALGEPVHRSAVVAVAAAVPGVVAVDLDLLHRVGVVPSLQRRLVADPARAVAGQPLSAELLAVAESALELPTEMP